MTIQLVIFLGMIAVFVVASIALKLPAGIAMALAAIAGALIGGNGVPVRHLVEGTFAYVDTSLVIITAMIFMKVIEKNGLLDALSSMIISRFHKMPAVMLCLIMLIIMLPGMITGSSTAAVLSAGSIMAPVLMLMGVPALETATIISMGGVLGMIAPPVNIPAMIIGGGIDIPYVGFELPLILLSFPPAFIIALKYGHKYVKNFSYEEIKPKLNTEIAAKHGVKIYLPVLIILVLMVIDKTVPQIPNIGMPLILLLSALTGLFTGEKVNFVDAGKEAVRSVTGVVAILMGVGMFIQVMTLTGVRGWIVNTCLSLPVSLRYFVMAVSIPAFGAVSAFGAASVLGVPFLLAFLAKNQVITAAAISLIAGVGDLTPPTALTAIFAAEMTGVPKYTDVLKKCIIPCTLIIVWAVIFVIYSPQLAKIL